MYYFVLDLLHDQSPVLYVNRNQNGNLADDGELLTNQGSGFFATMLRLAVGPPGAARTARRHV